MLEIDNNQKNEITKLKINYMYNVDNYLVINCGSVTFLTDGENIYNIKDYKSVGKVFKMGNVLYLTAVKDYRDILLNVETCEEVFSQRKSYYSGIFKVDEEHISTLGDENGKIIFNIKTRKKIKPREDLEFAYILADRIYQYQNGDVFNRNYYVVNEDGKIIYDCGSGYPHIIGRDLLIHYVDDKKVKIISSILDKENIDECDTIVVEKGGNILCDPQLYENEKIVVTTSKGVSILDTKLNETKSFDVDIDGEVTQAEVDKHIYVIEITKGEEKSCLALFLDSGKIIRHRGMVVLPFWDSRRRTIRCVDLIPNKDELYPNIKTFAKHSLIDEHGEEINNLNASDSWIIESDMNNKFLFFNVECKGNKVYNIDTKELIDVPYYKIEFPPDFEHKMKVGYGVKEDGTIDFFGEDLVVQFSMDPDDYDIKGFDFVGYFVNEVLWLIVPKSSGPKTFYRHLLIDKEDNIIYDSYYGRVNVVGSYFQILEDNNTMYVNSSTKEISTSEEHLLPEFKTSENISINDGELLIRNLKKLS